LEEEWQDILGIRSNLVNRLSNFYGFIKIPFKITFVYVNFLFEIESLYWECYVGKGKELQNLGMITLEQQRLNAYDPHLVFIKYNLQLEIRQKVKYENGDL